MPLADPCPSKDELADFLLGKLDPQQIEILESHLANCLSCDDTIRNLHANDTFTQWAGMAAGDAGSIDEQDRIAAKNLIERLQLHSRLKGTANDRLEDRAAEVLRVLPSAIRSTTD